METQIATVVNDTELAVADDRPSAATCDVRHVMMNLPVAQMAVMQTEYMDRRRQFREWLKAHLVPGIHFGFPPSCEPKLNNKGEVGVWSKGGMNYVPKEQWQAKPSLYKAGAQFICDLLNIIPTFSPDESGWQQLGAIPGTFVIRCRLYPRGVAHVPENLTGEGLGVRKVGDKGGNENNALKMAEKCAMVDSVLNAFGLSDLFTQDVEDDASIKGGPEPGVNPSPRPDPKVAPRGERTVDPEVLARHKALGARWKAARVKLGFSVSQPEWDHIVCDSKGSEVAPSHTMKPQFWSEDDFVAVEAAIIHLEDQVKQ